MEISAKTRKSDVSDNRVTGSHSPTLIWLTGLLMFVALSFFAFTQSPRPDPFQPASLFESFFKPREQNAFMRLPAISGKTNNIFALPDSELIWLVGNNGLIMHSADAGNSWQQQNIASPAPQNSRIPNQQTLSQHSSDLLNFISPIPLAHAGMSAEEEKKQQLLDQQRQQPLIRQQVMPSQQQQQQQQQQILPSKQTTTPRNIAIDEQLEPFFQYDQQTEEESIQQQEPAQKQKQQQPPAQPLKTGPADLHAVYFVNENRGIAVGDAGTILITSDGGANWQQANNTETTDLNTLVFSDENKGFVAGDSGTLLKTDDGGNSWQRVDSRVRDNFHTLSILDNSSLLVAGDNGTALLTRDDGRTWRAIPATVSDSFAGAAVVSQEELLVILGNGNIVKASGDQFDWQIVFDGSWGQLNAITMLNKDSGYVVGKDGLVLKTTDGGNNWRAIDIGSNASLVAISMTDSNTGYISASSGSLFKTSDGGESWQAISNGFARAFFDIAIINEKTALVVGGDGAILKTTDGGQTWQPKTSGTNEPIINIALGADNSALVVGENGLIMKTVDGGESWQTKNSGTTRYLNGISKTDSNSLLVVGDLGTILKSTDGGESWQTKTSNTNAGLMRVTAVDSNTLFAAGDDGTLVKTTDAGDSWQQQTSSVKNMLFGITFVDANRGFIVGEKGTLITTNDGGANWQKINSGRTDFLVGITMSNSNDGMIVGDNGSLLKTTDGGNNWQAVASNTQQMLINLAMFDANNGFAVGGGATILKTSDGGESWTLPEYQRYPAYWYWFTCGFFALFALGIAQHKPEQQEAEVESVADMLASDRPIEPGDPDPLAFGAIARGLSRFMRNPKTEPPLTVAITGAWGTGKSSLMNLLYYDLKKNGFTPVWFNAWHHQKGEQLLASLYANIRSQAVPGWFKFTSMTPTGLIFRLNLFFCRSKKHWILAVLMTGLFTTSLLYLYQQPIALDGFDLPALFKSFQQSDNLLNLALALLGGIPPVATLLRSLRAFGINPANLSTDTHKEKNTANGVDPSARHRLAAEFDEVTQSLVLGRMVIFIDDLDRCSKENVVDILESINFLAVSGDCYIILGMDKGWVQICITEQFKEMAKDNPRFAEEYLEKLINIEVPVPIMEAAGSGKLLTPESAEKIERNRWNTIKHWLCEKLHFYRSVLTLILLLTIGVSIGFAVTYWYQNGEPESPAKTASTVTSWDNISITSIDVSSGKPSLSLTIGETDSARLTADQPSVPADSNKNWQLILKASDEALKQGLPIAKLGDKSASAELLLRLAQTSAQAETEPPTEPSKQPTGEQTTNDKPGSSPGLRNSEGKTGWWTYPVSGLILVLLLIALLAFLMRKSDPIENDSPKFRQALNIWHPWITLNRQTPRAIKRYLNRVRYLAMRYREESEEDQQKDSFLSRLLKKSQPAQSRESNEISIDESTLVALSAIFAVDESWIVDLEKFQMLGAGHLDTLLQAKYPKQFLTANDPKLNEFMAPLLEALNTHQQTFGTAIFENTEERRQFLHILAATKMN